MNDPSSGPNVAEDVNRIFVRIPGVNDDGKSQAAGKLQLPAKHVALYLPRRVVIVIVQSGFADRDDPFLIGEILHQREVLRLSLGGVVRWIPTLV